MKEKVKSSISKIITAYSELPYILRKKVLLRILASVGSLIIFAISLPLTKNVYFWLPFLAMFIIIGYLAISLLLDYANGRIFKLEGHCLEVLKTFTKTKIKTIYFEAENKKVKIRLKEQFKRIKQGDYIILYAKDDTSVLLEDGVYDLNDYIAIQVTSTETEDTTQIRGIKMLANMIKRGE